jgi:hypothetical protein
MKTKFFAFIAFVLFIALLTSCKKNSVPASTKLSTTLVVTVKDGVTLSPSSGATVNLYESAATATAGGTPTLTLVTNQAGVATFTLTDIVTYYVIAINGAKKNYYNGLIPTGNVNGVISYLDANGDGKISVQDDVNAPSLMVLSAVTNNISTTIY